MVAALNRKLLRELGRARAQLLSIGLVVAAGIAVYVGANTAHQSLQRAQTSYYATARFADAFASVTHAPNNAGDAIRRLPGVSVVQTSLSAEMRVLQTLGETPTRGRLRSLPDHGEPALNRVTLVEGRWPSSERADELVLLEDYATANDIDPGDSLDAIVQGARRTFTVVGVVNSPEYVFAIDGNALSYRAGAFAVAWMRQRALAPLVAMQGAFNEVALTLDPTVDARDTIVRVDRLLRPYGAPGAVLRDKQVSHHYLSLEMSQLRRTGSSIPMVLLAVSALLLHIVLGRSIELQRGQIATLKALGYSNVAIAAHYLKYVSVVVALGAGLGAALGAWMGSAMIELYRDYFHLPTLAYRFDASVALAGAALCGLAVAAGTFRAVYGAVRLAPADAMKPAAPARYTRSALDRLLAPLLGPLGRMTARDLQRRPIRAGISALALAASIAAMVLGQFMTDSMNYMLDLQFSHASRETIAVALRAPTPPRELNYVRGLPGVRRVECQRAAPVRLRAGSASRETVILGSDDDASLRALIDRTTRQIALPADGVLLSDTLASRLGVVPGDHLLLERLEGDRSARVVRLAGLMHDMLGLQGYMRSDALAALLRDPVLCTTVLLDVDAAHEDRTMAALSTLSGVSSMQRPSDAQRAFDEQSGGAMLVMQSVFALFAALIAVGVVYNNARVTLSARSREFASMRVLGYTRGEVFSVLVGELGVQMALAIPAGLYFGQAASAAMMDVDPESFRMPAVVSTRTYVLSVLVPLAAAALSAALVRRRIARLDLIGVLKTRE